MSLNVWMKALPVILVVFLSAGCSSHGNKIHRFDLAPRFQTGERHTLQLVSQRTTTEPGKPSASMTTHTEIRLVALESTPNGPVVQWTRGGTIIDDSASRTIDPIVKAQLDVADGLRMDLLIDARGNGLKIRNWEEVQAKSEPLIDAIMRSSGIADNPDIQPEKIRQILRERFITEQRFLDEAALYFLPIGRSYSTEKPTAYTGASSNPFGGEPLQTTSAITLQSFDDTTSRAVLIWEQTFDRQTIRRFSKSMLYALMPESINGRKTTTDDLLDIKISDAATFSVDPKTGWVQSASHTHTYRAGNLTQVDSYTFTLSPG